MPNFKRYCEFTKLNPDELIALKIEGLQAINTGKEFQAETLLEKYLTNSTSTPSVKSLVRSIVISFYKANRRNLINIKEVETPEAKHRSPTTEEILALENNMNCARDKFLVWFLASSPLRLTSITKTKWCDLKPTGDKLIPYQFVIESARLKGAGAGKYKGLKHVGFLHHIAVRRLEEYKKELNKKGYIVNDNSPLFVAYRQNNKEITKLATNSIMKIFDRASFKAWHNLEVKRFSAHDFRRFMQTALEEKINQNIIAPLLSHKAKGIDSHYSAHTVESLLAKYKECLPYLLPQTVEKVKAELDTTKQELTETEKKLNEATEAIRKINEYLAKSTKETQKRNSQNKED